MISNKPFSAFVFVYAERKDNIIEYFFFLELSQYKSVNKVMSENYVPLHTFVEALCPYYRLIVGVGLDGIGPWHNEQADYIMKSYFYYLALDPTLSKH